MSTDIPQKQRVLILQGGGALGAYEAGVFEAIYDKFSKTTDSKWKSNLFDIIAGASIGAINATFLTNYFVNTRSWEGANTALTTFWEGFKSHTFADSQNPFIRWWFENYWNFMNQLNPLMAPAEAARRYWSWSQLANVPGFGARNLSYTVSKFDFRFLDPNLFNSAWLGYDYFPLKKFMQDSIEFPVKTSFEDGEPRLLLVGVDVQDCTEAVTFDSYPKKNDSWYSEYGKKYKVSYDGIGLEQLFASCLFPYALDHSRMKDERSKTGAMRTFWDGAFLSNTPLREVLQHHRDFWLSYFKAKGIDYDKGGEESKVRVPELEVYIINLYPSTEDNVPANLDAIRDREIDIKFHDRTHYDEQVAHLVTDYISLAEKLINKIPKAEANKILDQGIEMRSEKRVGGKRKKYRELLEGRFKVNVIRIDRQDDGNTIFGKHADFSSTTIDDLMEDGKNDAEQVLRTI